VQESLQKSKHKHPGDSAGKRIHEYTIISEAIKKLLYQYTMNEQLTHGHQGTFPSAQSAHCESLTFGLLPCTHFPPVDVQAAVEHASTPVWACAVGNIVVARRSMMHLL
jgi:hypothetical protein